MGFYANQVLPRLIHLAMRQAPMAAYRQRVIPAAEGRVLEIGVGSGHNLPLYGARTTSIVGIDPSPNLLTMARGQSRHAASGVELLEGSADALPLDDDSVDTVVTTWTLCSIPDVDRALAEVRRVLTPTGRLLFIEHGRANDPAVRRWQNRLTPLWRRIGGGCHLNRPIVDLIEHAGFRIERVDTAHMAGPKPLTFTFEGSARPL